MTLQLYRCNWSDFQTLPEVCCLIGSQSVFMETPKWREREKREKFDVNIGTYGLNYYAACKLSYRTVWPAVSSSHV